MASISKRMVGREPRYDVNYREPDGRRRRKTFRKKAEADRFAANVEADKSRGRYVDPDAGRVTFERYASDWLASRTSAPTSRERTESRLRVHAFPTLGPLPLSRVKPSTIQGWAAGLELAPSTKRSVLGAVSAVFRAAVDDELIPKNPCDARSVAKPRTPPRRLTPWPVEQVFAVRDALPERFAIVVDLAFGLGLRQGEVFGLGVDDVDFLRGKVEVRRQVRRLDGHKATFAAPKGGKSRTVPLPASVRDALAAYLTEYPAQSVTLPFDELDGEAMTAPLVVTREDGSPVDGGSFGDRVWRRALDEAGVARGRENGMHALRHAYASTLLDAGENIRALSEYLGHEDPGFTLRTYTHLLPASDDRTRRAVDDAFARYNGATSGVEGAALSAV